MTLLVNVQILDKYIGFNIFSWVESIKKNSKEKIYKKQEYKGKHVIIPFLLVKCIDNWHMHDLLTKNIR
jgi:hypothetical protein